MYQPLETATFAFMDARDRYMEAAKAQDGHAAAQALFEAFQIADAILAFLGYISPYECGECDTCKARAAQRRAEMQAAVDADPAINVGAAQHEEARLSKEELEAAEKLLADLFKEQDDE